MFDLSSTVPSVEKETVVLYITLATMIMLACRMIVCTLKIFLGMQDNNVIYSLKLNMVGFRSSTVHYSSALWQCYCWVVQFLYKM